MRKIEKDMIRAIRERKDMRNGNTTVTVYKNTALVRLHGNLIAVYSYKSNRYLYSSAGWQTATTKSRLNALGANIRQKDFSWFDATTGEPFEDHTMNELLDFHYQEDK